jgi:molybdenum cofactor guanylyltransferase
MSESQKSKGKSQKVNFPLPTPITGIVLAGGKSSRMGRDKALLPVDGVPLLQKVCEVAVALCDRVYVVTPWQERYQHFLPVECEFIREVVREVKRAEEAEVAEGAEGATTNYQLPITNSPLIGFAQGLTHVETEWVLLLACDLPYLQLAVLQDWATELEGIPKDAIALLPRHSKGWEPLCGFYRRSCLNLLETYIDWGGRSFQQWLAQHPVQPLNCFEPSMLFNCNTPTDYAAVSRVDSV